MLLMELLSNYFLFQQRTQIPSWSPQPTRSYFLSRLWAVTMLWPLIFAPQVLSDIFLPHVFFHFMAVSISTSAQKLWSPCLFNCITYFWIDILTYYFQKQADTGYFFKENLVEVNPFFTSWFLCLMQVDNLTKWNRLLILSCKLHAPMFHHQTPNLHQLAPTSSLFAVKMASDTTPSSKSSVVFIE